MSEQQHPITPPPELRRLWAQQAQRMDPHDPVAWLEHVANKAARWGDEQRLEACCEWLEKGPYGFSIAASASDLIGSLRAAMRPKPPRLAEEALNELDLVPTHDQDGRSIDADTSVIRRALERLKELEHND